MKKIKLAMIVDCLRLDGISAVIMNYCTHLDLDKFDITIVSGAPITPVHRKRCDEIGIRVVGLPVRKKEKLKYYIKLGRILKEGHFDICHVHGNSATSSVELVLAAIHGVPIRIMHCHNSRCQHESVHKVLVPVFKRLYTQAFACSALAGNWIFGEGKFKVLSNGFETEKFKFNIDKRNSYRSQLGLDGKFVIGHVGQINNQKNTEFSIKLFETVFAKDDSAYLLLVGNGRDKETYEEYVKNSACRNKIILYGESDDVPGILSAMDVFIFPSRYEGLGISVIEAQINGLPCIISDAVPRETQISENVVFLPIGEENYKKWGNLINFYRGCETCREKSYAENSSGIDNYDISHCAQILEDEYLRLYSTARRKKFRRFGGKKQ